LITDFMSSPASLSDRAVHRGLKPDRPSGLAAELHERDAALGDQAAQVADAGPELVGELVDG